VNEKLLQALACPHCYGDLSCRRESVGAEGDIVSGALTCSECGRSYPITNGIPRFVPTDNYAASFGYQWSRFRSEQLDSVNGFDLSARRFFSETGWSTEWMSDKWILDAGCGAGRFLDVASQQDCEVVGVDLSHSVDAARETLADRPNVHLVQASIYDLPFRPGWFDGCFSIGVIQHTPNPHRALETLPRFVKNGGRVAVTIYQRKPWTHLYSKYIVRRVTTRMSNRRLMTLIQLLMPVLFPITEIGYRLPVIGRVVRFVIPVSNYVGVNTKTNPGLSLRQRYRWALMDTFDMLSPQYDEPQWPNVAAGVLERSGVSDVVRTSDAALCLAGRVERAEA
jgi:uncharacterized protein YbaR (Trm112 family)/2-polyprenyl-3-methyl-5-hydroxy-6-metoxy-1,4-benzoquinol methylase